MEAKISYYCCLLIVVAINVKGHGAWGISMGVDTELGIRSIPGLKTIRTYHGDSFDCVDIYRQPSLDDPLLQGHLVQMRPSSMPEIAAVHTPLKSKSLKVGFRNGCPLGTVPMRRTPRENRIQAKAFFKAYPNMIVEDGLQLSEEPGSYIKAEMKTRRTNATKYYGAHAVLNVYNPKLTTKQQFSRMMMKLRFGPESSFTSVQVGWAVFPALYNDNVTRLHTYWGVKHQGRSCIDVLCSGFVQINRKIPLGMPISVVSTYHGNQYDLSLTVFKDPRSHHWWLLIGATHEPIGYWPRELFGETGSHVTEGRWGGDVHAVLAPLPPMGSGLRYEQSEKGGYGYACYIRGIQVQEKLGGKFGKVNGRELQEREDLPMCYTVGGPRIIAYWGYTFYVGGNGRRCSW